MSTGTARAVMAPPRLPIFAVQIGMYVKLKPEHEVQIARMNGTVADLIPDHWRKWDFDLRNDYPMGQTNEARAEQHRRVVARAVEECIDNILGSRNGWRCELERNLLEWELTVPPDPRKWWGIEILSPPMSVSKQWQQEIEMVYKGICKIFDIWTDAYCSCNVHISPGPTGNDSYTLPQLIRMAKGAYFWDKALCDFLPFERRFNSYGWPNYAIFGGEEFKAVPRDGWGPVFAKLDALASGQNGQKDFLREMRGGQHIRPASTDFSAFTGMGTVVFRRQAGAASPRTTVHRILLAITLHLSSLRYDFDGAKSRATYPSYDELRKELAGCIKKLPSTCHGTRFLNWLTWCLEVYRNANTLSDQQINEHERALRTETPPLNQTPSSAPQTSSTPSRAPAANSAQQDRPARAAGPAPTGRDATAQSGAGRGSTGQTTAPQSAAGRGSAGRGTPPQATGTPRPQPGRSGAAPQSETRPPTSRTSAGNGGGGGSGSGSTRAPAGRGQQGTAGTRGATSGGQAGGRGAPTRNGTATTTRLPERPAAASSSSPSSTRSAAAASNRTTGGSTPRRRPAANDSSGQ